MKGDADIAAAARLLAESARAELVLALMDQHELAAGELAARAGITPSTASQHLARLVEGNVLAMTKRGRRRHYRIANPAVAEAVEALAVIAPQPQVRSLREATRGEQLRYARTCYDHLAGRLGVALARSLEHERALTRMDGGYVLGPNASARLDALGVDLAALEQLRRPLVRGCLDWSERELHVAGSLGAAVALRLFELGWIARRRTNRSVEVTEAGRTCLRSELGIDLDLERVRAA
jgi:DNA-binding transcriptional ArsR family regulator